MIADLIGKGRHIRTVSIPTWTKRAVDEWMTAAGINNGAVFCRAFLARRRGYKWARLARNRGSRAGELKMLCIMPHAA